MRIGIDIGSTTVKVVLLDDQDNTVFHTYERHMSKVREKTAEMLRLLSPRLSGQAVQVACHRFGGARCRQGRRFGIRPGGIRHGRGGGTLHPRHRRGGGAGRRGREDHLSDRRPGRTDERLLCRRHRRFIDQMATLLGITADELDRLSLGYEKLYAIASRCGVFAKSDIQPLLNQGRAKRISRRASSRPWSTRPSPAWPRDGRWG